MPWDFWIIFLVLAVVLPWRGWIRLQHLLALPAVGSRERIGLYFSTILFQWIIAGLVGWRAISRGISWNDLGLGWKSPVGLALASLTGAVILGGLHWLNLRRMGNSQHDHMAKLRAIADKILPHTKRELIPYLLLAITAGVCEEFIYRGFAMAAIFRAGLAVWGVILISSILFGLAHLYQGRGGILGTLLLGAVFGIARIAYDSVVPVAIWHATIDIVAGIAGAKYLLNGSNVLKTKE